MRQKGQRNILSMSLRQFSLVTQICSCLGLDGLEYLHKLKRFVAKPLAVLDLRINGEDKPEPEVRLVRFLEDDANLVQEVGDRLRTIGLAIVRANGCRGLRELKSRVAVLVSAEPLEECRDISRELERSRLHFTAKADLLLSGHSRIIAEKRPASKRSAKENGRPKLSEAQNLQFRRFTDSRDSMTGKPRQNEAALKYGLPIR